MWMYDAEIRMMMYSFGDEKPPRVSTSKYIECLVKDQAKKLIFKSKNIQMLRKGAALEVEDVCFVLRKDSDVVCRILQSFNMKIYRFSTNEDDMFGKNNEEQKILSFDWIDMSKGQKPSSKLKRLDDYTSNMSMEEYSEFSKCREASFTYRKRKKFKAFVGINKIKDEVVDVIGLVCHEIVFDLVDAGLNVMRERYRKVADKCKRPLCVKEVEEGFRRMLKNGRMRY